MNRAIAKIEYFAIMFNGFQILTIVAKSSRVPRPTLHCNKFAAKHKQGLYTEDYVHKCNRKYFREEKEWYKIIHITIAESTEDSKMIFLGLEQKENDSYGQKYFRETNNCLCKVSTV